MKIRLANGRNSTLIHRNINSQLLVMDILQNGKTAINKSVQAAISSQKQKYADLRYDLKLWYYFTKIKLRKYSLMPSLFLKRIDFNDLFLKQTDQQVKNTK